MYTQIAIHIVANEIVFVNNFDQNRSIKNKTKIFSFIYIDKFDAVEYIVYSIPAKYFDKTGIFY